MDDKFYEVNFDGLVGPTHHYAGLSFGNVASMEHKDLVSHPKKAALQGLEKMRVLHDLGLKQAILPPHERPAFDYLRAIKGLEGSDESILEQASLEDLSIASSASAMWTANALTMAPSVDTIDQKTHLLTANLVAKPHRAIEADTTYKILERIFSDKETFKVHPKLLGGLDFGDEGAANHNRLCSAYHRPGLHLFIFGRFAEENGTPKPNKFPARQTFEASDLASKTLDIETERVLLIQQNPEVIDAGVFHNDVISVCNQNVFLFHEKAFLNTPKTLEAIERKLEDYCEIEPIFVEVKESEVSLEATVGSYLFNTQIVTLPDQKMAIIAPRECETTPSVKAKLDEIVADSANPIRQIYYFDLRESMQNGGGPACLRNRVVLSSKEINQIEANVILNHRLFDKLATWVEKYYRETLKLDDLRDPQLIRENREALEELTAILNLGSVYPFQN